MRTAAPRAGRYGRPTLIAWSDVFIVRVIKRRTDDRLTIELQQLGCGRRTVEALIAATQGAVGKLNTADVERLNATFRQRFVWLTRRSRVLAQQMVTVQAGMYIVGCFYNFCDTQVAACSVGVWVARPSLGGTAPLPVVDS